MTPTPPQLDVAVVGAGIGGLATAVRLRAAGHRVTVLEQAHRLLPVGAGIQLAPNATSVLARLGVLEVLDGRAVAAAVSTRRRYADGRCLGQYPLGEAVVERFGSPYLHAHRGDLHAALESVALRPSGAGQPVTMLLGTPVAGVEQDRLSERALVVTADGRQYRADVVIGADGIHSRLRDAIAGPEHISFSGDVAHRSLVPRRAVESDPSLAALVNPPSLTIWLGPGRHLVHYLVCGGEYLNVVLCAPGDELAESWSAVGDVAEVAAALEGWDARALALVRAADTVHRTGLYDREPLDTWHEGRVALLGDACHPMLPYQAQGAAQALEDADALGEELDGVDADGVPAALAAYAARRRFRAATVQRASRLNRHLFHLPDGPDQAERDRALGERSGDFDSYAWIWAHAEGGNHP